MARYLVERTFPDGLVILSLFALTSVALAGAQKPEPAHTLVEAVRQAATGFKDVEAAKSAGYGLFHGCVSGPQAGAIGIYFVNGDLVGDGEIDASRPEALIYEAKNGTLQLVGVEYVVIAEAWDANMRRPLHCWGRYSTMWVLPIATASRHSMSFMSGRGSKTPMACSQIGTPRCRVRTLQMAPRTIQRHIIPTPKKQPI